MSEIKPFTGVDDRVPLADAIPLCAPFTLNIFPSEICNFRCNYCAQSLGKDKLKERYGLESRMMSLETMQETVEQAQEFPQKFKLISMMGHGEPLCNKDLPKMIALAKKGQIADRIDVITNASLLTREYSDMLIESGLDVLRVSLQGISSESYENTCGVKIDFDSFLDNLSYFYQHKKQCRVYVKTMDVSLKAGQEKEFYDIFSNISDRMYIDQVKPVYEGVAYSTEAKNLTIDRYGNTHTRRIVCSQPFYMLSVWTNGDVTPCDALYKACPLGNIHTHTLYNMWNCSALRDFRILHLDGKKDTHSACCSCCAPDDVQHDSDVLDDSAARLRKML